MAFCRQTPVPHLGNGAGVGPALSAGAHDHVHEAAVVLEALEGAPSGLLLLVLLVDLGRLPPNLPRPSQRTVNLACEARRSTFHRQRQPPISTPFSGTPGKRPATGPAENESHRRSGLAGCCAGPPSLLEQRGAMRDSALPRLGTSRDAEGPERPNS